MAFTRRHVVELAGERGGASAAQAMSHDQDLADVELGHRELQRRGDAVIASARLIGRREGGDVAHDEHLAGVGVEDLRRVAPAVGAGENHHLGL